MSILALAFWSVTGTLVCLYVGLFAVSQDPKSLRILRCGILLGFGSRHATRVVVVR